jgi:predicted metal-dependent phosphoesterase TrpH
MMIDLHTHSYYSDGVLSPTDLMARAHQHGVRAISLTDHDTTAGIAEAEQAAAQCNLRFCPGVEISCSWATKTIHVLGLGVDPSNKALSMALDATQKKREVRIERILNKLRCLGLEIKRSDLSDIKDVSIGRLHVARYLLESKQVSSLNDAFKRYLGQGKKAYFPTQWMSLEEAVTNIHQAGGVAVIAHPRKYRLSMKRLTQLVEAFTQLGGQGIEYATTGHSQDDKRLILTLIERFSLYASSGSDFHYPGGYIELGKHLRLDENMKAVWQLIKGFELMS